MSNARAGADAPHAGPKKNAKENAFRRPGRGGQSPPANGHGKKGRSGRKPLVFKQECERLRDVEVLPKVAACLAEYGPTHAEHGRAWLWCVDYVTKYTTSPAPQKVEATGEGGGPIRFTLAIGEARGGDG